MGFTWAEAEVAALDRHRWRQSVAQCVQLDAGWIKVKVKVKVTLKRFQWPSSATWVLTEVYLSINLRHHPYCCHHNTDRQSWPFDAHCCHMGTATKNLVPDRVKPSFVIFDYKWRHNLVWHRMLYSCRPTHMATVGVKGLILWQYAGYFGWVERFSAILRMQRQ